jgi:hypothetical protein
MLLVMRLYQKFNIDSTPATAPLHPWHALWKNYYAFVSFIQLNVWCIDGIFFTAANQGQETEPLVSNSALILT